VAGNSTPRHEPLGGFSALHHQEIRDLNTLQNEIITALSQYDEEGAEQALAEAFSFYPIEQVGDKLFMPALVELSDRRERGELSLTTEHFASNYLLQRLGTLLHFTPNSMSGPLIWVGCARTEAHEAGALLLSIYLRRSGYRVHYLGHNLSVEQAAVKDLMQEASRYQPAMILFSASTAQAAEKLGQFSSHLTQNSHLPTMIGYSGPIYTRNPELHAATTGVYVGTYAKEVVQKLDELLADKRHPNTKTNKLYSKQMKYQ
jgi:methanogenic corrinoid protein MtbC1